MTVDVHQAWTKPIRLYQYGHVIQKSSRPCGGLSILKTFRNLWKIDFLAILQLSASQVIDALVQLNNSSAKPQQYLLEAGAPSPILRFHVFPAIWDVLIDRRTRELCSASKRSSSAQTLCYSDTYLSVGQFADYNEAHSHVVAPARVSWADFVQREKVRFLCNVVTCCRTCASAIYKRRVSVAL